MSQTTNFRLEKFLMLEKVLDILSQVLQSVFFPFLSLAPCVPYAAFLLFCKFSLLFWGFPVGRFTHLNLVERSRWEKANSKRQSYSVDIDKEKGGNEKQDRSRVDRAKLIFDRDNESFGGSSGETQGTGITESTGPDEVVLGAVIIEGLEEKYYEKEEE